jgi:hypothetical protein
MKINKIDNISIGVKTCIGDEKHGNPSSEKPNPMIPMSMSLKRSAL